MAGDFIGRGWSFPPTFERARAGVRMLEGTDDIDSSLEVLVATAVGERVMRPRYGLNLEVHVFDPASEGFRAYIRKRVEDAILYFEPRITLDGLEVAVDDGRMEITVQYTVKSSNSRANVVVPYDLAEGSGP